MPVLFAAAAFAAFVGLGTWQIQRKAWKEALIGTLEARLAAPPVESAAARPLARPQSGHRRIPAGSNSAAAFIPGEEALVYTSGSAFRPDVSRPRLLGVRARAPARAAAVVVVNRGFVPEGRQDPASRADGATAGLLQMVGVLRWPEVGRMVRAESRCSRTISGSCAIRLAIAAAKGWPSVAPFFVELESPQPPGGMPRAGVLKVSLRNEHLQYALTWYALAVVVVVMFAFWLYGRRSAVDAKG